jgi:hypothetical protein
VPGILSIFEHMIIDEARKFTLTKYATTKGAERKPDVTKIQWSEMLALTMRRIGA